MELMKKQKLLLKNKLALFLILFVFSFFSVFAVPSDSALKNRTVKVGYVQSTNFLEGENDFDHKSGYGYEYLQKIAAYTGWNYEYVYGSWIEILEKLKKGQIDIVPGISYTDERAKSIAFPDNSMGFENYYIYAYEKKRFVNDDIKYIKDSVIGCTQDSMQNLFLKKWNNENGNPCKIKVFDGNSSLYSAFVKDEIDAVVDTDNAIFPKDRMIPIIKVGESQYFLGVSKSQPEILQEINICQQRLNADEPYFIENLHSKYFSATAIRVQFSHAEKQWLSQHEKIKIGYAEEFLAFCGNDKSGNLTGALKTFIESAVESFPENSITFEAVSYKNIGMAIKALKAGEVDAVFPIYQSLDKAERNSLLLTEEILKTPMTAIILNNNFDESAANKVAVAKGYTDIEWYVKECYPKWLLNEYKNFNECLTAVSTGAADCVVESTYVYKNLLGHRTVKSVALSKVANVSFAVNRNDKNLLLIMNRAIAMTPHSALLAAMTLFSNPDSSLSFITFVKDNVFTLGIISGLILLCLVFLLIKANASEAKAKKAEKFIRKINAQLRKSQSELQIALIGSNAANQAKTAFLNNMSHDIRTPMNAIIGFTSLAERHIEEKKLVLDYLSKISISSNHLLSLINDVLDMSRIESGCVKIEEKEVHLPDILHDLKTIIQPNVSAKKQNLYIDVQNIIHEDVFADKLRLSRILLNIAGNAIKFTGENGTISILLKEEPSARENSAHFKFCIKDNGIGMSQEFRMHIFEAFSREQTATVSGIQGTGLGMAITKNIVDMMGGTINVNSTEGKGSEFIVELDLRIINSDENSISKSVLPLELHGCKILIADSRRETCLNMAKMLCTLGFQCEWTTSGNEAIHMASQAAEQGSAFKGCIIDRQLNDIAGIEAVRKIKNLSGKKAFIAVLTDYDWSGIENEARNSGVTDFLSKPVFMSELSAVFAKASDSGNEVEPESSKLNFKGKKILLAEDNILNQEIAVAILQDAGFFVDVANDGCIAVEKIENSHPGQYDLILMDVQMPEMDGYTATRKIRSLPEFYKAQLPIIAMTANAFQEDRDKALESGMNDFISKPIDITALFAILAKVLA